MKRRILYVESGLHGGGSAESLAQLLEALDRSKYEPFVAVANRNRYWERLAGLASEIRLLPLRFYNKSFVEGHRFQHRIATEFIYRASRALPFWSVSLDLAPHRKGVRELIEFLRSRRIDLIHTNNQPHRDMYAIAAAREAGVPVAAHIRTPNFQGMDRRRADFLNQNVKHFMTYSQELADLWSARGLAAERIEVIPNAIGEVNAEPADLRAEYGFPPEARIIGIVGRIKPHRGHPFLFRAFRIAAERRPELRLLVVGEGTATDVTPLREYARATGLEERVVFAGYSDRALEIIAGLDVLAMPFLLQEPFGRVLLEAWRLRTPVALTRIGYIERLVEHEGTALIVDPNDDEALADALIRLSEDRPLRERIANEAYRVCVQRFSIAEHARRIESVYERVLSRAETQAATPHP